MKAETIKNEMENSKALVPYSVPDAVVEVDTEFISSDDLEELEEGVRNLGKAGDVLALAQGVAIVKIESEGYWQQGGYPNLRAYRIVQSERLGMPPSTITLRRRTAEAWLKYRKVLGKLDLTGKVSMLAFFDEAVLTHGLKESVQALTSMSFRDFQAWVSPRELEYAGGLPEVDFSLRKGEIVIDGLTVGSLSAEIPEEERDFLASLIRKGYSARKGNMLPLIVPVYDQGEGRAVENFIKKYRANK